MCGEKIKFWHSIWLGFVSLKPSFPRLFMVSVDKVAFIDDMGEWKNDSWCYNLR